MSKKISRIIAAFIIIGNTVYAQSKFSEIIFNVSIDKEIQNSFKPNGRLFIYLSQKEDVEPKSQSGIGEGGFVFARNLNGWKKNQSIKTGSLDNWLRTSTWDFKEVPNGIYHIQAVWDQDVSESRSNAPGNLYSNIVKIDLNDDTEIQLILSEIIQERELVKHELVKRFTLESEILSSWWEKPIIINTSILLPSGYFDDPEKQFPVRYNIAGYGGRYTRVNRLINDEEFISWWTSGDAPQIITVFLDGEGPFGDSYQINSENNGPYGDVLIEELIPAIENVYSIISSPEKRFVDGCSTGGWVSLALQLFYPNQFNGCWSYSPDPVDFRKMQLLNIYEDENAFYNEANYLIPSMRDIYGEPIFSIKEEITSENVQGYSNSYLTSGKQWGAWNAVYSPKGADGLPKPLFDPITGTIDKTIADSWKRYDLLQYTKQNWSTLGPEIQDKIHIWMGDMDNFYLNNSLRAFEEFLSNTSNPKSNAEIVFSPMKGHCWEYSHKTVLENIQKQIRNMEETNGNISQSKTPSTQSSSGIE